MKLINRFIRFHQDLKIQQKITHVLNFLNILPFNIIGYLFFIFIGKKTSVYYRKFFIKITFTNKVKDELQLGKYLFLNFKYISNDRNMLKQAIHNFSQVRKYGLFLFLHNKDGNL